MYNLNDLLVMFVIAIFFILLFKLQKELFENTYFANSALIAEIETSPRLKDILIRIAIIFSYGILLNFIIDDTSIIIMGVTLGSILIVWPLFLSEENIELRFLPKKFLLRTVMILFVFLTFLISNFSVVTFNLMQEFFSSYFQDFNNERLINLIGDSIIWLIIVSVFSFIYEYVKRNFNNKVNFGDNNYEMYDPDEVDMYGYKPEDLTEENIDDNEN